MWRNVRTTDIGVVGGGLTTTVLPAMSAYGRLAPRIASGQLNGKMIVTTPSGTWAIVVVNGGPASTSSSSRLGATAAALWNRPTRTSGSIVASNRVLPFSRTSSSARSSASLSSPASAASESCTRSAVGSAAQAGHASCAARTASSASAVDAAAA